MTAAQNIEFSNRIPVSIITGFLGSGKTTLLNHLVSQPGMESAALIINEFGEIGLDNLLVESAIENTLLLENGCICCSVRGDLIDTVGDLFAKARNGSIPDFSRILIETTGLAEPSPIINTIQNERVMADRCRLDSVVTLIDGVQGISQAKSHSEARAQIAQADLGLITKRDLIDDRQEANLRAYAEDINPTLTVTSVQNGEVAPGMLFGRDDAGAIAGIPEHHHEHHYDPDESGSRHGGISTWSYVHKAPLDRDRLNSWLKMIYSLRAAQLLRFKGLLRIEGHDTPLLIQAVGPVLGAPRFLPEWPSDETMNRLVFIAKGLPAETLEASFKRHVLAD